MNIELTQETLCKAIQIAWSTAHEAETESDWQYRWNGMTDQIEAIRSMAIYGGDVGEYKNEFEDDFRLLWDIAFDHAFK